MILPLDRSGYFGGGEKKVLRISKVLIWKGELLREPAAKKRKKLSTEGPFLLLIKGLSSGKTEGGTSQQGHEIILKNGSPRIESSLEDGFSLLGKGRGGDHLLCSRRQNKLIGKTVSVQGGDLTIVMGEKVYKVGGGGALYLFKENSKDSY